VNVALHLLVSDPAFSVQVAMTESCSFSVFPCHVPSSWFNERAGLAAAADGVAAWLTPALAPAAGTAAPLAESARRSERPHASNASSAPHETSER
jgi:hypothetical protein